MSHLQTTPKAKAEHVAAFLISLVFYYLTLDICKFTFWLDNARTHKKQMKTYFAQYLEDFGLTNQVEVEFKHIPPYSPNMKAAEYFIQLIRKKHLKNIPPNQSIEQVVEQLIPKVDKQQLLTSEQMTKLVTRIKRIPHKKTTFFKLE